jgi:Tfp pilus assembly protein PilZ
MAESNFIERRKECRLPYSEKVIFTDGQRTLTAYAANISRGGVFAMSLDPWPIDTTGFLAFCLPNQEMSICVKAKVVHIVFDRQRCEIECGMGFQFQDLTDSQKSILNLYILNEQSTYRELKKLLDAKQPNTAEIARCLKRMPSLLKYDLLGLRYKVNRICTIFEPAPVSPLAGSSGTEQMTA